MAHLITFNNNSNRVFLSTSEFYKKSISNESIFNGKRQKLNHNERLLTSSQYKYWFFNEGLPPGKHCWGYYPGTLSCSEVSSTHLKTGHPWISSMGAPSSNKLQWLHLKIGHQNSSPSNNHQGTHLVSMESFACSQSPAGLAWIWLLDYF